MNVDWVWGLIGGGLIGLGAAVYLLGNGRIMGASGILGALVDGSARDQWIERLVFLAALAGVPAFLQATSDGGTNTGLSNNWALVVLAGLLVGLGTRVGNGCTSGHGVCGISRLSIRAIVATVIYIAAGAIVVVAIRLVAGGI